MIVFREGKMRINKTPWAIVGAVLLALCACSRQQSDWQKTREANTADSYELFVKKYPSGEFTAQAQARLKELYEERDWQKARDADTPDAYQAFIKQYPEGKWTEEARIRVENFTLAQTPTGAGPAAVAGAAPPAAGAAPEAQTAPAAMTPSKPAPQPSTAPPAAAKPAASAAKLESGKYAVQFGAFRSGSAADKHWVRLRQQYPKLLAGLSSKVVPKKTASGMLYRLQAVGMAEGHARRICKDLKAKSQPCVVVRPPSA
jgi:cell division protein FtsN